MNIGLIEGLEVLGFIEEVLLKTDSVRVMMALQVSDLWRWLHPTSSLVIFRLHAKLKPILFLPDLLVLSDLLHCKLWK